MKSRLLFRENGTAHRTRGVLAPLLQLLLCLAILFGLWCLGAKIDEPMASPETALASADEQAQTELRHQVVAAYEQGHRDGQQQAATGRELARLAMDCGARP